MGAAGVAALLLSPSSVLARQPADLAVRCIQGVEAAGLGTPERIQGCAWGSVTAHALQSGIGLLMASGGVIPSSPSTAGTRFGGSPRWVLDVGGGFASFKHPDLSAGATPASKPARTSALAPRITLVRGVFDGISLAPGVGGIGSVDVVADVRLLPLPGFESDNAQAMMWGGGLRFGILRESFILPGITVSGVYRQSARLRYGTADVDRPAVEVAPRVTSVGAMVGKDLLFVGVSAGVQRDWIKGDVGVVLGGAGATELQSFPVQRGAMPLERTTWYVGANWTFIIAQFAAQLGWAEEPNAPFRLDALPDLRGAEGGLVGGLSFRITY